MLKRFAPRMMMAVALVAGITLSQARNAAAVPVDLELSLVVDVSGSINDTEFATQLGGYAAAFEDAGVQSAITALAPSGGIAVNMIFFGSTASQQIGWMQLDSAADADAFAGLVSALTDRGGWTNIAAGVDLARGGISSNDFEGERLIIDVSGDGKQNCHLDGSPCGISAADGIPVIEAQRDAAELDDIIINGITVGGGEPLRQYYQDHVITTGGFAVSAADFSDFVPKVRDKIFREITGQGTEVPEPGTLAIFGLGLAGLGYMRRKRAA